MRRLAALVLAVVAVAGLSSCSKPEAAAFFAAREIGRDESRPADYMRNATAEEFADEGPLFAIIAGRDGVGFWCDEFVVAMLNRAGIPAWTRGDPRDLVEQTEVAEPPYRPGDLVFVTFDPSRPQQRYDHVGILRNADGEHLWVVDGNWSTGRLKPSGKTWGGVVLNERWVGDGAVTEIRRFAG